MRKIYNLLILSILAITCKNAMLNVNVDTREKLREKEYSLPIKVVNISGAPIEVSLEDYNNLLDPYEFEWCDFQVVSIEDREVSLLTVDSIAPYFQEFRLRGVSEKYASNDTITVVIMRGNDRSVPGPLNARTLTVTPIPATLNSDPNYRVVYVTRERATSMVTIAHEIGAHLMLNVGDHPNTVEWYELGLDSIFNIHGPEEEALNIAGYGYCRSQWTKEQSDSSYRYMTTHRPRLLKQANLN